jgi:GNAT superfamily N-acetyltransferase
MAPSQMASMAHAVEANLFSFFAHLKTWPRVAVHDDADCCWTISDLPFPLFNSVMHARVSPGAADALIDARIAACEARHVPMLWWTGPSTSPDDLGDRLDRRGFLFEPAHGMVADLDRLERDPTRTDVAIEAVTDLSTLRTWSRVLCDSFGAPQPFGDAFAGLAVSIGLDARSLFRHFLARVDGEPAATCSMFLGAGVAGIYDVSTVPERRRCGIGRAITAAAMHEARALGYRTAILHSSTLGTGVYRSLGFEDVCDIGQFVWVPQGFR